MTRGTQLLLSFDLVRVADAEFLILPLPIPHLLSWYADSW